MNARNAFVSYTLPALAITLCLASCSYTGTNLRPYASWTGLIAEQTIDRRSRWAIDANSSIYVVMPATGHQDDELVADMLSVFQRYYPRARLSAHREALEQAFVSARFAGMDYVVYPHITDFADQSGIDAVIKEEISPTEFRLGEARMNIFIYAAQGEELVDHLRLDTRGSIFTRESRRLIWPPLDAYLKSVSQFDLVRR